MTVWFNGQSFGWDFVIASVSLPILDFLCAQRLLVDMATRRLVDAVSFATYLCTTGGPVPFALANILALADVYERLLAEFPALTVPTFSAVIAKHGVEHHVIPAGPPFFAKAQWLDAASLGVCHDGAHGHTTAPGPPPPHVP